MKDREIANLKTATQLLKSEMAEGLKESRDLNDKVHGINLLHDLSSVSFWLWYLWLSQLSTHSNACKYLQRR